jgi:hypothetical protein
MGAIAFAAPILPGKTESAKRWGSEIRGARHKEYEDYRKRYGITKEFAGIQQTPQGELFVGYFETADVDQANQAFAASNQPFDVWFKEQLREFTGQDFNQPLPPGFVEVLFGE